MIREAILEYKLDNLPYSSRKWKYLSTYRAEWEFLPSTLRNRVAEQLMTADYLVTLDEWLQPAMTIQERQRVLIVQILATIYEGVLNYLVTHKIRTSLIGNAALTTIYDKSTFYGDKRTFSPTLELARKLDLLSEAWVSKIDKIVEIRNWVHLSNSEKKDVFNWVMNQSCHEHRAELDRFRTFIKDKF